ncbi:MAG TPA: nucleotidyltransferase family protein [Terracidiphilus sp.]|nr:nucleotidyltransferase family protein [Terracidiphilus sp.]
MKAMVLAAGLGTRLRPLTNDRPKALVEVDGRTMLAITLERLRSFGIRDVIVNVHHHGDMIVEYLGAHDNFGMKIAISREEDLLDTGGGLKKAGWFFLENDSDAGQPFLVHNVDVISTIDLARMVHFHSEQSALATLAVQDRRTSRPLLFDEQGQLRGRGIQPSAQALSQSNDPAQHSNVHSLAFSGIHIVSPRLFAKMHEQGAFSIVDAYVRLAAEGEKVIAFRADAYEWLDLGRPEHVAQAAQRLSGANANATLARESGNVRRDS